MNDGPSVTVLASDPPPGVLEPAFPPPPHPLTSEAPKAAVNDTASKTFKRILTFYVCRDVECSKYSMSS
jgi:hypothetical protein